MYRVIVAEDDIPINNWICHIIKNNCDGFKLAFSANNGQQALNAFLESNKPIDVVITDIVMPIMNGIELARKIRDISSDTVVIMLTCHSDFSYAKEGIELGISRYLLKDEVTQADIVTTMQKLKLRLDEDAKRSKQLMLNRPRINQLIEILLNEFDLLPTDEQLLATLLQIDTARSYFCACIFLGKENQVEKIISFFEEGEFDNFNNIRLIYYNNKSVFLIGNFIEKIDSRIQENDLNRLLRTTQRQLEVNIGVSEISRGGANHKMLIIKAYKLSQQCYFYKKPTIISRHNYLSIQSVQYDALSVIVKRFNSSLPCNKLEDTIKSFFATIINEQVFDKTYVVSSLERSVDLIHANNTGADFEPSEIKKQLRGSENIFEAETIMSRLIAQIPNHLILSGKILSVSIDQAVRYINQNYRSSWMSLQDIAEHLMLNPSYFSALFKEETGMNYHDYLTTIRMESAHKLLCGDSIKISTVAQKTGYDNAASFSRAFSKYFGYSPKEVQRNGRGRV